MTRPDLENLARFLKQGLTLDRETQQRLVDHALGSPTTHRQGCAFFRGEACDCLETGPMDLSLKSALTSEPSSTAFVIEPTTTVELTLEELRKLPEYSLTLPTATTTGKRWRRHEPYMRNCKDGHCGHWWRGEYVAGAQSGMVGIVWLRIVEPSTAGKASAT
jgi:hypothetical protein